MHISWENIQPPEERSQRQTTLLPSPPKIEQQNEILAGQGTNGTERELEVWESTYRPPEKLKFRAYILVKNQTWMQRKVIALGILWVAGTASGKTSVSKKNELIHSSPNSKRLVLPGYPAQFPPPVIRHPALLLMGKLDSNVPWGTITFLGSWEMLFTKWEGDHYQKTCGRRIQKQLQACYARRKMEIKKSMQKSTDKWVGAKPIILHASFSELIEGVWF